MTYEYCVLFTFRDGYRSFGSTTKDESEAHEQYEQTVKSHKSFGLRDIAWIELARRPVADWETIRVFKGGE